MRYRVELNDEIVDVLDVVDHVQYNLTSDALADLREELEGLGYDWSEIAYVWEQRPVAA
jgi:hypothetical protein